MWPYWGLFLLFALVAVNRFQPVLQSPQAALPFMQRLRVLREWGPTFVLITLMIGLRHDVGGDWPIYLEHLEGASDTLTGSLAEGDPAYSLLNWGAAELGLSVYFVNSACAVLFVWGLLAFCRRQPLPWLALVVAVPYLITVVAMGYTRQGVAIGLFMIGLAALDQGRVLRFFLFLSFAATFHRSAILMLPLGVLAGAERRLWVLLLAGLASVLLFGLLLDESIEGFRTNYIEAEYASSGAQIRVAMNALPAAFFLILRGRFKLAPEQRVLWFSLALSGIGFMGLLYISPSSTAVDRMALYWIPLQLFVLSRLPAAVGKPDQPKVMLIVLIVLYSAAVQFVWLFFADHAFAWLPYQFYPWVWWQQ